MTVVDVVTRGRPILFSGEMVRAILDGRKTQTRRVVVPQPSHVEGNTLYLDGDGFYGRAARDRIIHCPYGAPGDRLWVRETWTEFYASSRGATHETGVRYKADGGERILSVPTARYGASLTDDDRLAWRPSIHMPRWASRITLEITDVRVQRVQEISEEDAIAEGMRWVAPTEEEQRAHRAEAEEYGEVEPRDMDGVWIAPGTDCGFGPKQSRERWAISAQGAYRWFWDHLGYGWEANSWVWAITFRRLPPVKENREGG